MERSDIATEVTLSPRSPQSALFNSQEATQRSCWGHCFKHLTTKENIFICLTGLLAIISGGRLGNFVVNSMLNERDIKVGIQVQVSKLLGAFIALGMTIAGVSLIGSTVHEAIRQSREATEPRF